MTDLEILNRYAVQPSNKLFADLVNRHIDLVYSSARRQVRDPAMAEDVTQSVFILLFQKAGAIRGSLPSWLLVTTAFVARNAVKTKARRIKHERRAAQMKHESAAPETPAEWESYAPLLDAALANLRQADRDVLTSRYFTGKAFRDLGVMIGVSEEAARKRVNRALERLRQQLMAKVSMPAAAVLGSHLDRCAVEAAPQVVATKIVQGGATLKAGAAHEMVSQAQRASFFMKLKVAAISLFVAGAGCVVAVQITTSRGKPPVSSPTALPAAVKPVAIAPLPPPAVKEITEANRPGMIQVMRWNVMLDQSGTEAVEAAGEKFATASKLYQAMHCDASTLRHAVTSALDQGEVVGIAHDADLVTIASTSNDPNSQYQLNFIYQTKAPQIAFYGGATGVDHSIQRLGVRRGRLQLNHPKTWMNINDGHRQNETDGSLICDHEVTPGQSIAFLGHFESPDGEVYGHLVVWEAYAATAAEAAMMSVQHDAGWWCRSGPDTLRRWADQAYEWGGAVGGRPWGPPSIERKLEDGESIWLWALARPSKWPFCWWDSTGKPAGAWPNAYWMDGEPMTSLTAQVGVTCPSNLFQKLPPDGFDSNACHTLNDGGKSFEVGVPIGQWIKVGNLKVGQKTTAGGIEYLMLNNSRYQLQVTGLLNDDFRVIPINADGTRENLGGPRSLKWDRETAPRTYAIDLSIFGQPASFIIQRRHRQFVTFRDFAQQPITPPPACPTADQENAVVQTIRLQATEQYLNAFPKQRASRLLQWFLGDPTDYHKANDIFLHAAILGDEKTVRHMLIATDPEIASHLDVLAHTMCVGQILWWKAKQQYGEATAHRLFDQPGLFEDIMAELMGCGWIQIIGNESSTGQDMGAWDNRTEPLTWHLAADGKYYLNVDGLAEWPDITVGLDRAKAEVDLLQQQMVRKNPITAEKCEKALADFRNPLNH